MRQTFEDLFDTNQTFFPTNSNGGYPAARYPLEILKSPQRLRVNTTLYRGFGDALYSDDVSGGSHVSFVSLHRCIDCSIAMLHDASQFVIDFVLFPEEVLEVLHPLEIA